MTAVADVLQQVGSGTLFAGFNLWIVLFAVAAFRDPKGSDLFAWSINTQWAAGLRILRRAAAFRWWGRLAKVAVVSGVTCLLLSGMLAMTRALVEGPKG